MVKPIENQRMLDLLRVCRGELFVEHGLITDEEYSWLATLPSKETHARLADYGDLKKRIAELELELKNSRTEVTTLREHWRKTIGQDVLPGQEVEVYEAMTVTIERFAKKWDEARKLLEYSGGANLLSDLNAARADAARLREALEALVEYERKRHPPKMGGDHLPPTLREVMDIARAALASAPSAEPTPREAYMRVAEAVRREASGMVRDADDGVPLNCLADAVETIDLAAVVAKALEVGT